VIVGHVAVEIVGVDLGFGFVHRQVVKKPKTQVNTYMFDGQMAYEHSGSKPVYAPNSFDRGWADGGANPEEVWSTDGELVRSAYTLRADDDDFSQPGTLVREVFDDGARDRLVAQVSGSLLGGLTPEVLERALDYWRNIDAEVGKRIEEKVRAGNAQEPVPGMGES
jgi:catalase